VAGAVSGDPIVQLFVGQEPYFRDNNTEEVFVRPAADRRDNAKMAHNHFDRFRPGSYILTGLNNFSCSESNGGDLSYGCTFNVSQQGVGLSEVNLALTYGGQIYGWSVNRVVKSCGALRSVGSSRNEIVTDGHPVGCARVLRVVDRFFNDESIEKMGSAGVGRVGNWICGTTNGNTVTNSGVAGGCGSNSQNTTLIFSDPTFVAAPGQDPSQWDSRATICSLAL